MRRTVELAGAAVFPIRLYDEEVWHDEFSAALIEY